MSPLFPPFYIFMKVIMHIATANPLILTNRSWGEVELFPHPPPPLFFALFFFYQDWLAGENRLGVMVWFCHLVFVYILWIHGFCSFGWVDKNRLLCPKSRVTVCVLGWLSCLLFSLYLSLGWQSHQLNKHCRDSSEPSSPHPFSQR